MSQGTSFILYLADNESTNEFESFRGQTRDTITKILIRNGKDKTLSGPTFLFETILFNTFAQNRTNIYISVGGNQFFRAQLS
jgi:hypothetical protein